MTSAFMNALSSAANCTAGATSFIRSKLRESGFAKQLFNSEIASYTDIEGVSYRLISKTRERWSGITPGKVRHTPDGQVCVQYIIELIRFSTVSNLKPGAVIPSRRAYTVFRRPLYRGHAWRTDTILDRLAEHPELLQKFHVYHFKHDQ